MSIMGSPLLPIRESWRVIRMFIIYIIKSRKMQNTLNKPPTIPKSSQIEGGFASDGRIFVIGVTCVNHSGNLVDTLISNLKTGRVGEYFHITSLYALFSFCSVI